MDGFFPFHTHAPTHQLMKVDIVKEMLMVVWKQHVFRVFNVWITLPLVWGLPVVTVPVGTQEMDQSAQASGRN